MLKSTITGISAYIPDLNKTISKIAGFDLDGTLIRTIRGKFPKSSDDWTFLPHRLEVLTYYQNEGYAIVIFTNQNYRGKKLTLALDRVNNVIQTLLINKIYPYVFVGTSDSTKKPNVSMWTNGILPYLNKYSNIEGFFVGDAAGRSQDFSDSDLQFSNNIGLPFYTPDQCFPITPVIIPDTQTMFIFVGMPGAGKSTYYKQNLQPKGYIWITGDVLKTFAKIKKESEKYIKEGYSIAIDATNGNITNRRGYIELAIKYNIKAIILYFVRDGHQLNSLRTFPEKPVPEIAYSVYYKNLSEPNEAVEGVPVVEIE